MASSSPPRIRGLEKNRLEALIDGVFAVALTLLVLDLKLPEDIAPKTNAELGHYLLGLERHFVIYVVSFVVIGMYWITHHVQFHFVVRTNRPLIWINLVYLLLISFLPFATDLIGDHKELMLPCEIYGFTLLALTTTGFVHIAYLARHRELVSAELTPAFAHVLMRRAALFGLLPLMSMVAALFSTHAAVYVYLLLVVAHFFPGHVDKHLAGPDPGPEATPHV